MHNLHSDLFVPFLDPNIPETGEQLARSNNGPDTCCYVHCDPTSVYKGICAYCNETEGDIPTQEASSHQHNGNIEMVSQKRSDVLAAAKMEPPPQTCHLVSCVFIILFFRQTKKHQKKKRDQILWMQWHHNVKKQTMYIFDDIICMLSKNEWDNQMIIHRRLLEYSITY